jgi:RimJ/RimL family protein N-acetyltransferase
VITDEEFIDFQCPSCQAAVSFPHADGGFVRACPACNADLIVPEDRSQIGRAVPLPITTSKLSLRRFGTGDWKDLMACLPAAEEDNVLHWLEADSHVRLTTPDQIFHLGIELQGESKLIGFLGLRFTDAEHRQATLSISINEMYAGKDFELEAVDALLGFCFEGIKLHRVTAMCGSQLAECQLFEQIGMRREGEFVKDRSVDGEWVNTIWFAALKEEYLKADS